MVGQSETVKRINPFGVFFQSTPVKIHSFSKFLLILPCPGQPMKRFMVVGNKLDVFLISIDGIIDITEIIIIPTRELSNRSININIHFYSVYGVYNGLL